MKSTFFTGLIKKMPVSITFKILLVVLPLSCFPIAIVGFLSYKTSVESVTNLSRKEQVLQANAAANQINAIFFNSCKDLETIAEFLPDVLQYDRLLATENRQRLQEEKTVRLLHSFYTRSPYYRHIRYIDPNAHQTIIPAISSDDAAASIQPIESIWQGNSSNATSACSVSKIVYSPYHGDYVVQFSRRLNSEVDILGGMLLIDLNFGKIIDQVTKIRFGKKGFAFIVDQSGRTIAHPMYEPYEYDLSKYDDSRLLEFVVDMIMGETGWRTYNHFGEKAAAFAPIPITKWSLAVSIPIEEFKEEGRNISAKVFTIVIIVLILSGLAVSFLSIQLLRPVRQLVYTTERIAAGDLQQEIPVKSNDELGHLSRSFNRMVRNLRAIQTELVRSEKLISMGRLSAGIAHEVRNPLNAMKGAIVYLQECHADDDQIQEFTGLILEEINRLNDFVGKILLFAKQSPPSPEPTDFVQFVNNTINFLAGEMREKKIEIRMTVDHQIPPVNIDPQQIGQVMLNLFSNAIHAMPDGGTIDVTMSIREPDSESDTRSCLVFSLKDSGCGIPRENLENIFDPFFSTRESGTGLGLPISLGIVESHGGTMKVLSEPEQGTTVIVELPMES